MVSLVDEIPMITKGESVLYKYAVGGDAMLLEYCDMLNIENQHLYDSNEELSCQVLHLETALETLESRVLHIDHQMEHCLSHTFMGMVLQRTHSLWKVGISGYPSCLI